MFSPRHASDLQHHVRRALLLMVGIGLLLALPTGGNPSPSLETAASTDRATASVAGGERKKRAVRRVAAAGRRATPTSRTKIKRVTKPQRVLKTKRRTVKPSRPRTQPPRPRAKPERRTQPAAARATEPAQPNDPLWNDSWSLGKVNAPAAWQVTTGRPETVVAVLDTGVDLGHPDLQGAFVAGYDAVNRDDDPSDDHGHGTMVAGVIAARSNNGVGVTSACWRCSVMPVKVIGADGTGNAGAVAEGIIWAAEHGAHVINLSFTMNGADYAVGAAIEHARSRGVVVVAAAGNNGTADATYPAAYPGVVSVAGTDPSDARYGWSSFGSWVSVAAPGCNLTTAPGGTYGEFCGTSSATAFVSGFAGLVRSLANGPGAEAVAQALSIEAAPTDGVVATGRLNGGAVLGAFGAPVSSAAGPSVVPEPGGKAAAELDLP